MSNEPDIQHVEKLVWRSVFILAALAATIFGLLVYAIT